MDAKKRKVRAKRDPNDSLGYDALQRSMEKLMYAN